ncbi:hypothetical protein amb0485 [Paramagnetospirillum magneticum AMB-1]|uniref:Uncharacterized protein n=1 Tax=Paramagnetospirillum magneticum (strain ATCC 700264 / AMB-1) TaxID=342108 RepID=Q2WA36_PARM1|nr:hypothetical protein amb0485 [Paramagnetospirillum magneticum AMB-1]
MAPIWELCVWGGSEGSMVFLVEAVSAISVAPQLAARIQGGWKEAFTLPLDQMHKARLRPGRKKGQLS